MSNAQLYLAIGVPLLFNALGFTLLILYLQSLKDVIGGRNCGAWKKCWTDD